MFKLTPAKRKMIVNFTPSVVVFGVAAWQSYWHTVEVASANGEASSAYLMAFSTDGLMIAAARVLMNAKSRGAKAAAGIAFGLGVVATFAVNLLAANPNPAAIFMAVWPAVAMTATSLVIHLGGHKPASTTRSRARKATPANVTDMGARGRRKVS